LVAGWPKPKLVCFAMATKQRYADFKKSTSVSSQNQQWTDYLSCTVCEKEFNRTNRCPISLVCGHTVCRSCLGRHKHGQCNSVSEKMTCDLSHLPVNSALLQLVPADVAQKDNIVPATAALKRSLPSDSQNFSLCVKHYENAKADIEELALHLKPNKTSELSRPMQKKLIIVVNCQLVEEEGRKRAIRGGRALGERAATELILLHQNPSTLSASLWTAVRGRGCQFLGPAMQEEALKLIHLALEDGAELSRKILVQLVVNKLETQFSQASKTSVGHVVQLLYRASCFNVTKREGESSLMRLKDEFLVYEELRKEHDAQIVQIAREAGLRIAPDQWSALLYGDQVHKSYMQSIIDKLQSGVTFFQCIQDLNLAVQRSFDPGNIQAIIPYFTFLSEIDSENPMSDWAYLARCMNATKTVVQELVNFTKKNHHSMWLNQDVNQQSSKYKTSMCRDFKSKGSCPRGHSCTFAHSDRELQIHRNRRKKGGQAGTLLPDTLSSYEKHSKNGSLDSNSSNSMNSRLGGISLTSTTCQCSSLMQRYSQSPPRTCTLVENPSTYQKPAGSSTVQCHPTQNVLPPSHGSSAIPQHANQLHSPEQLVPSGNVLSQPRQPIQYVSVNPSFYNVKQYEPAANPGDLPAAYLSQVPQAAQVHVVPEQQMPPSNQSLPPAVVQHNQYMLSHQQLPQNYYSFSTNQMQAMMSPQNNYVRTPYVSVHSVQQQLPTAPSAEQMAPSQVLVQTAQPPIPVPHTPELLPQTQLIIQPPQQTAPVPAAQPGLPVALAQPDMVLPVAPPMAHSVIHMPQVISQEYLEHSVGLVSTTPISSHVHVPSSNYGNSSCTSMAELHSLEELRQRKYEVINKLVQKRITAPKAPGVPQQPFGSYPSLSKKKTVANSASTEWSYNYPSGRDETSAVSKTYAPVSTSAKTSAGSFSKCEKNSSSGYNLWSGTTCIPTISARTISKPEKDQCGHTSPAIDVLSDMDTRTSQVPASSCYSNNAYVASSTTHCCQKQNVSALSASLLSLDDDFSPIRDQRIVSKYGPIARNVRSKLTSSYPEQVVANKAGQTRSFPSDKERHKSHFSVNSTENQNIPHVCTEVEPSVVESVVSSNYKLPDILCVDKQLGSNLNCVNHDMGIVQAEIRDEEEDLQLAIELQQIEMGIQEKLQNRSFGV